MEANIHDLAKTLVEEEVITQEVAVIMLEEDVYSNVLTDDMGDMTPLMVSLLRLAGYRVIPPQHAADYFDENQTFIIKERGDTDG